VSKGEWKDRQDRKALCQEMFNQGYSKPQIAEALGIGFRSVYRYLDDRPAKPAERDSTPFTVRLGDVVSKGTNIFTWVWDASEESVTLRMDGHHSYEPDHETLCWPEFFALYRLGTENDKGRIVYREAKP
jgi:hypothetical protein